MQKNAAQNIRIVIKFCCNCYAYHIVKPMPNGEGYADCMQMALDNVIVNGSDELGLDPNLMTLSALTDAQHL